MTVFRVVDLDSHNGTSVNGIPVKERLLAPGDRISLGGASFLFVDPSAPPAATELELEDAPLPSGATVQLRAEDAVYLKPERLGDARLKDAETRNALGATLELISLLGSTTDGRPPRQDSQSVREAHPRGKKRRSDGKRPGEPGRPHDAAHAFRR